MKKKTLQKPSIALIDGNPKEYDIMLEEKSGLFTPSHNTHIYIGKGTSQLVCGVKNYNNKEMHFWKEK